MLVDDLEAHVLEHRQHVRQRHRPAAVEDAEAEAGRRGLARPVHAELEDAGRDRALDVDDVLAGAGAVVVGAVADAEGVAVLGEQREPVLLAVGGDQLVAQVVLPRAAGRDQPGLDRADVGRRRRGRVGLDDEVEPGQHRFVGDLGVVGGDRPVERVLQDLLERLADRRGEAVARHVDQARGEALEGVVADEQRDPLALLQVEHAGADPRQVVVGDLEQLVARIGQVDVQQRLVIVAVRREGRARQRPLDLEPEQRHVGRRLGVDGRGEQADEDLLADDALLVVEPLDADGVEMDPPVHGRAHVGLVDDQHVGLLEEGADVVGQARHVAHALEDVELGIAQDAEPAVRHHRHLGVAAGADDPVLAIADEGEMVVGQPVEEGAALLQVPGLRPGRVPGQRLGDRAGLLAHRLPVLDRGADVGEHAAQAAADRAQLLRVGVLVDLDPHPRFGDRVLGAVAGRQQRLQPALGVARGR